VQQEPNLLQALSFSLFIYINIHRVARENSCNFLSGARAARERGRPTKIPDEKTLKSGQESQQSQRNVARKEKELKDFFSILSLNENYKLQIKN
jgi:hypothetical protein